LVQFSWVELVLFSVHLVFRDGAEYRYKPPTSQRSHSAAVGRGEDWLRRVSEILPL